MSLFNSSKVTLSNDLTFTVEADMALIVTEDCYDISDVTLKARTTKRLTRGTTVVVRDITDSVLGSKTIRAYSGNTLYYIQPKFLTLPALV